MGSFAQWRLQELGLIRWIQEFRDGALDEYFLAWNIVDTTIFYLLLVCLVMAFEGRRWALRCLSVLLLSGFVNVALKAYFALPRPCVIDPTIGLIHLHNFSFPSGAAQSSVLLPGLLLLYAKRARWLWFFGCFFGVNLSFSRIYLGVHLPSDIVAGWVVGGILLAAYIALHAGIEEWLFNHLKGIVVVLHVVALLVAYFASSAALQSIVFDACGAATACLTPLRYTGEDKMAAPLLRRCLFFVVLAGGAFALIQEIQATASLERSLEWRCVLSWILGAWFIYGPEFLSAILLRKKTVYP